MSDTIRFRKDDETKKISHPAALVAEANRLMQKYPVVDGHCDFPWRHMEQGADIVTGENCRQVTIEGWQRAGVRVQGTALYTPPEKTGDHATAYVNAMIDYVEHCAQRRPDALSIVHGTSDFSAMNLYGGTGTDIGLVLWIEGAAPFAGRLDLAEQFIARGVRGVGLTHNGRNEAADGCMVENPQGLTDFGRELVVMLQMRNVTVDLAHVCRPGFWEAIRLSHRPMVVSHTGIDWKVASPRNLDDQQIHALADIGGVIGVDFYPGHIGKLGPRGKVRGSVHDVFAVIDYIVKLVGDTHVGLGSDFDGYDTDCVGLETIDKLSNLVCEMLDAGYDEARIARILGGNWLRVLNDTWVFLPSGERPIPAELRNLKLPD